MAETVQIKKYTISYYVGGWSDVIALKGYISYPSKFGTVHNNFSCYCDDWVKYDYPQEIPVYINKKILSLYKKLCINK